MEMKINKNELIIKIIKINNKIIYIIYFVSN